MLPHLQCFMPCGPGLLWSNHGSVNWLKPTTLASSPFKDCTPEHNNVTLDFFTSFFTGSEVFAMRWNISLSLVATNFLFIVQQKEY